MFICTIGCPACTCARTSPLTVLAHADCVHTVLTLSVPPTGNRSLRSPELQRVAIGTNDFDLLTAAPRSASRTPSILRDGDTLSRGSPPLLLLGPAPAEGAFPDTINTLGP